MNIPSPDATVEMLFTPLNNPLIVVEILVA
jgi:hypothetical protein